MSRKAIYILSTFLSLFFCAGSSAQSFCNFSGQVLDAQTRETLPFASIRLKSDTGKFYGGTTDEDGKFNLTRIEHGSYLVTLSYIGYETQKQTLLLNGNLKQTFLLTPNSTALNEVVVTASESKGITSASKIDRTAMEHLQPTSFTDLLALLPGGSTQTPNMSAPNTIRLREVGLSDSDYNTSSLGTKFIVDGTPINTDANMQQVDEETSQTYGYKTSVNAGVDMRNISTDNIETVEFIRGIPSARYGDLTSGVVIIKRKMKATPFEARFKADQYGKLFYGSKGLKWEDRNLALIADAGYLDSKADPRDHLNNFKRINASARLEKVWNLKNAYQWTWTANLDYNGNIDCMKTDPDIQTQPEDNFRSTYNDGNFNNTLEWKAPEGKAFRSLTLTLSAQSSWDKIERSHFIQLDRDRVASVSYEPGEYDAEILPYKYTAHATVNGNPLSLYAEAATVFKFHTGKMQHTLQGGANWTYAKNFGDGQVYDLRRPLNYISASSRPRKYSDIPASEQLSLFIEDELSLPLGQHLLKVQAGLRTSSMLNLDSRYTMSGVLYADPRINAQWSFPGISIAGNDLKIDLSGGVGWLTKMPTLSQLYPDKVYMDIVQLNYWNANADYRRINLRTYVADPTNYDLKPARNFKWEVRLGLEYHKNYLSVTYFRENMGSGFRNLSVCNAYEYKKYDTGSIDGSTLIGPPALEDIAYSMDTLLQSYGQTGNGSRTFKEGVEFQFASERFKVINTRLTIAGAWLRTRYENSQPTYRSLNTNPVVNGVIINDKYRAIYQWGNRYVREQFNTNFTLDTDVKKLGLRFSATVECQWFYSSRSDVEDGVPIAYMDQSGQIYPYTEADKTDLYKQHLIRNYNSTAFDKTTTPFYMYVNFKATKTFGKYVNVALFADRMLDYVPDYERNGMLVRRQASSPYFGMELNFKF